MKRNSFRNLLRTLAGSGIIAACLCSCGPRHNTLTEAEIADGWQLLFDGKTLDNGKTSTAIRSRSRGTSWTAASRPKAAAAT